MAPEREPVAFHHAVDDLARALRGQRARRVEQTDDVGPASALVVDVEPDRAPVRWED